MFNKNIDRLFQEKFKDFEEIPSKQVWENIDKQLNNKTVSSFFYFRIAGIVASFILLFGYLYVNKVQTKEKQTLVVEQKSNKQKTNSKVEHVLISTETNLNKEIEIQNNSIANTKTNTVLNSSNTKINIGNTKQVKRVFTSSKNKKISPFINNFAPVTNNKKSNTSVDKSLTSNQKNSSSIKETTLLTNLNTKNISNNMEQEHLLKMRSVIIKPLNNQLALVDLSKKKIDIPTIFNKSEENYNKWEVGSVFTPIYYASLTKGSPLDKHIANNDQTSSNSYAYGMNVSYKLNKKWGIKTGLFKRNLSYKTKDVGLVFQVITSPDFQSANIASGNGDFELHSMKDITTTQDVTFIGDVKQQLNYIELPIEMKYNIVDKKININVNGGFSTLFLNENKITFERTFSDFNLGKATNINDISYSLNIGFDTSLKLSKEWKFSVSPTFKYHLQTFSEKNGGFRPYSIGVNTGLFYDF